MEPVTSPALESSNNDQKSHLGLIEVFVFLNFFLLLCLYPAAFFRRRCNSTVLKAFAIVANAAILSMIPYIYGLMRNMSQRSELVAVWAVYLLYVFVNVPDFLSLKDSLSLGVAFVKLSLYGYYISIIIYTSYARAFSESFKHIIPVNGVPRLYRIINIFIIFRFFEITVSRALLTYDRPLRSRVNGHHDIDQSVLISSNEDPWLRCNYAVYHDGFTTKGITIQEIWGIEEIATSWEIKSYCLSLSLLWKLVPVFKGRRSYHSKSRAWNLVRNGLLDKEICGNRCPFRVIEVELALLHDYIYNSSCFFLYHYRLPFILAMHLARLTVMIWIGVSTLQWYHSKGKTNHDKDVFLTWIIVIASTLIELVQFIGFGISRWQKMLLLCTYLIRESWEKPNMWDRCITKATAKIFSPTIGGEELYKPWQRQLGQYSLLDSYSFMQENFRELLMIPNRLTGN